MHLQQVFLRRSGCFVYFLDFQKMPGSKQYRTWLNAQCRMALGVVSSLYLTFGTFQIAQAGDFSIDAGSPYFIHFSGEIDSDTPNQLEKVLKSVQPAVRENIADAEAVSPSKKGQLDDVMGAWLWLDSPGGDVEAAIHAGQIARAYHVSTWVGGGAECASACVLLFLAGGERAINGRIGIHRPYSVSYSASISESTQKYRAINALVMHYLESMNVPSRVMEAMDAVPPQEIRWLSPEEAMDLGMDSDPIWKDRIDSIDAKSYGLTKQQYYAKQQRVSIECRSKTTDMELALCFQKIMGRPH